MQQSHSIPDRFRRCEHRLEGTAVVRATVIDQRDRNVALGKMQRQGCAARTTTDDQAI
ncbi:MAG: hypothetical protein ACI85K_002465 [Hyphomicrobiaceae bacterium]